MLLTVHAAAGILISQQINNPLITFLAAFGSHFLLDIIPHGDSDWMEEYQSKNKTSKIKRIITIIIVDVFALMALFFIAYFHYKKMGSGLNVFVGILGAVLPDMIVGLYESTKTIGKRFCRLHFLFHDLLRFHLPLNQGLFLQVVILAILLLSL